MSIPGPFDELKEALRVCEDQGLMPVTEDYLVESLYRQSGQGVLKRLRFDTMQDYLWKARMQGHIADAGNDPSGIKLYKRVEARPGPLQVTAPPQQPVPVPSQAMPDSPIWGAGPVSKPSASLPGWSTGPMQVKKPAESKAETTAQGASAGGTGVFASWTSSPVQAKKDESPRPRSPPWTPPQQEPGSPQHSGASPPAFFAPAASRPVRMALASLTQSPITILKRDEQSSEKESSRTADSGKVTPDNALPPAPASSAVKPEQPTKGLWTAETLNDVLSKKKLAEQAIAEAIEDPSPTKSNSTDDSVSTSPSLASHSSLNKTPLASPPAVGGTSGEAHKSPVQASYFYNDKARALVQAPNLPSHDAEELLSDGKTNGKAEQTSVLPAPKGKLPEIAAQELAAAEKTAENASTPGRDDISLADTGSTPKPTRTLAREDSLPSYRSTTSLSDVSDTSDTSDAASIASIAGEQYQDLLATTDIRRSGLALSSVGFSKASSILPSTSETSILAETPPLSASSYADGPLSTNMAATAMPDSSHREVEEPTEAVKQEQVPVASSSAVLPSAPAQPATKKASMKVVKTEDDSEDDSGSYVSTNDGRQSSPPTPASPAVPLAAPIKVPSAARVGPPPLSAKVQLLLQPAVEGNKPSLGENAPTCTMDAMRAMSGSDDEPSGHGLFGAVLRQDGPTLRSKPRDPQLLLHYDTPFTSVICGVQGSGKSHSTSVILENCLHNASDGEGSAISGLVLHFENITSGAGVVPCEAAYLANCDPEFDQKSIEVTVFVSPNLINRMRQVYAKIPGVNIEPFYLTPEDLDARERRGAQNAIYDEQAASSCAQNVPLYMASVLGILMDLSSNFTLERFYQRIDHLRRGLAPMQDAMLTQRIGLLRRTVKAGVKSIKTAMQPGKLVVLDLSDPFIDAGQASSIFEIVLGLHMGMPGSKVVALDEAHKYLKGTASAKRLTQALLSVVRQQRHLGARVIVSTQEPTCVPEEILDLSSFVMVHRFSSPAWGKHLAGHVGGAMNKTRERDSDEKGGPSGMEWFAEAVALKTGEALLFSPSSLALGRDGKACALGTGNLLVRTRRRITTDGGRTVLASHKPQGNVVEPPRSPTPQHEHTGW